MRIAVLIAASVLLAACSAQTDGRAMRSPGASSPTVTTPSAPRVSTPPAVGAPISEVIRWIEAATSADPSAFHTAIRDGATTQLGDDVAFTTPSGTSQCMTDQHADGALACLLTLTSPPPRPADVEGEWKGGWVDFPGMQLDIGSAHGDPGRFGAGTGAQLPYGQALAFGDYRCRSDPTGLFCVDYAHQSAARFSDAGVGVFGCLRQVEAPPGIGSRFSC